MGSGRWAVRSVRKPDRPNWLSSTAHRPPPTAHSQPGGSMATTTAALPPQAAQERSRQRATARALLPAYLMCAPTVLLFLVFMVFPIIFVFYTSFLDWNGIGSVFVAKWTGLENYRRLVHNSTWWAAVKNTVIYALLKLAVELPLALLIALVLSTNLRGRAFFRIVGFLPVITSIAVVSLAFTFFSAPTGGASKDLLVNRLGI